MKYCRFMTDAGARYGQVAERGGALWIEGLIVAPQEDFEARWEDAVRAQVVAGTGRRDGGFEPVRLDSVTLLAPVNPSKIVCVGRNYKDHAAELGNAVPREPMLFLKPPSALLALGGVIRLPSQSQRVDFEGELAVVIGQTCTRLRAGEDVRPYIRGYTIVNDVTARDLQKSDGQWSRAKGFDTFCPVGPLVSDEIDVEAGVAVETRVNGELRQQGNTRDLIFPVAELLRYISAAMTLLPGDLIPTGTPAGVGAMAAGDVVDIFIAGIGSLRNSVAS